MLGRIVLLLLQLVVCWQLAPIFLKQLPVLGSLQIFVLAVLFALVVWVVGLIGAQVLKDVPTPSSAVLTTVLIVALIGAGLTLIPQVMSAVAGVFKGVPKYAYPLAGAVLGYLIRR